MRSIIQIFVICFSVVSCWSQTKMVEISGGNYQPLYSLDSQLVKVAKYKIDEYQVSNADYLTFIKNNISWKKSKAKRLFVDENYLKHWISDTVFDKGQADAPIVYISWFAAKEYCKSQDKRLVGTAEWELVAQASDKSKNGYKDPKFNQLLLDFVSSPKATKGKTKKKAYRNIYGVYDMHGSVWEWTYDFNSALTTGESRENSGLDKSLFCGGGSFSSKDVRNYAAFLRYAMRSSLKANYCIGNLGFRCAK